MAWGMELTINNAEEAAVNAPLIQQVCRHQDSYSSFAVDARWEAAASGFMALCAAALPGLSPNFNPDGRAIKVFIRGPL